jgi:NAD(P)-dependent dehydrogenase (short-subunit alcohol dehydrogenase family)
MNWEMNIRGVYWVTRELLPLLLEGEGKTIVNISSVGAQSLSLGASGYQSTKFALLRFTEFICAEYASRDILAYCVHPGAVSTELGRKMPQQVWNCKKCHPRFENITDVADLTDTPELAGDTLVSLTANKREWLAGRYISVNWNIPELYRRQEEIVKEDKLKMRMKF